MDEISSPQCLFASIDLKKRKKDSILDWVFESLKLTKAENFNKFF